MSMRYKRNGVRNRKPVRQLTWRPRTASDVLPDLPTAVGTRSGKDRCGVVGLMRGDCPQPRWKKNPLCYYHMKLARSLMDPSAELYPVWPIPKTGYVLLETYKANHTGKVTLAGRVA